MVRQWSARWSRGKGNQAKVTRGVQPSCDRNCLIVDLAVARNGEFALNKIVMTFGIVLLAAQVTGCPATPVESPLAGDWIFSITRLDDDFGVRLNADGTASYSGVSEMLSGTVTWEAEGDRLILHQTNSSSRIIWIGAFLNNNSIEHGYYVQWDGPPAVEDITAVKQ